jgi:hypothetical protein
MLNVSAIRLANAESDATVAPVECACTSNVSADRLANAKANAANAPV